MASEKGLRVRAYASLLPEIPTTFSRVYAFSFFLELSVFSSYAPHRPRRQVDSSISYAFAGAPKTQVSGIRMSALDSLNYRFSPDLNAMELDSANNGLYGNIANVSNDFIFPVCYRALIICPTNSH